MSETDRLVAIAHNGWQAFPDTAPRNKPIIIGGIDSRGLWVTVVAYWGTFNSQENEICHIRNHVDPTWIVSSFITLANYPTVKWMYWIERPAPPLLPYNDLNWRSCVT